MKIRIINPTSDGIYRAAGMEYDTSNKADRVSVARAKSWIRAGIAEAIAEVESEPEPIKQPAEYIEPEEIGEV